MDAVTSRRLVIVCLLGLALVPVIFIGACLALSVGAGILNYREDKADAAAARADTRLQRPLVSTSGRILFHVETMATYDTYVVNADGTGAVRLTHSPPKPRRFPGPSVLSPDGTRLLMVGGDGLSLLRLDRSGDIARLPGSAGWHAWSPDGRQLAAISVDSQKRLHLNVFAADGRGEVRDLAAGWPSIAEGHEQGASELVWSPDGKRFAFLLRTVLAKGPRGAYRTRSDLYVAPSDGSGLKNLSRENTEVGVLGGLAWSPDGARLAFASGRGIGTVDMEWKWTEFAIQMHESRTGQVPAWSPDSRRLAWFHRLSIVTSDPDGGQPHELTRGRDAGVQPAWSPDGSRLVFVCGEFSGLCVMNSDGSALTRVVDLRSGGSVFETGAQRVSFPVWLPQLPSGPPHSSG
jgi:dipeptidyl aminopeptidase/acylaminoacyl peptidase